MKNRREFHSIVFHSMYVYLNEKSMNTILFIIYKSKETKVHCKILN